MKKSTYYTIDDKDELSVCYNNVYCIEGQITYLTTEKNIRLPQTNKFTNLYKWSPIIKTFNDDKELSDYIKSISNNIINIDLGVFSFIIWVGNMGHALFDGIYPAYLALNKFGYIDDDFVLFTDFWENRNEKLSYDAINNFCGNQLIELTKAIDGKFQISNQVKNKTFHIKTLITGTGRCGNKVMREDYTLYGKKYNGVEYFKERMFKQNDIIFNKPINNSPKIIIIDNKRFDAYEKNVLNNTVTHFKNKGIDIKYIYWESYKSFKHQLKELEDTDIQISGPGNAITYTPFLKKNAVNINLGWMEHTQKNAIRPTLVIDGVDDNKEFYLPAWMEQSLCAGADYVNTIFYDRGTYNKIEFNPMIDTINKAINISKNPSIHKCNHNIDAQIFIEYCKLVDNSREICDYLTDIGFFVELLINEHPHAFNTGLFDIKLLRELKDKFKYNRKYEIKL